MKEFNLSEKIRDEIGIMFGDEVVEKMKVKPYIKPKFVKEFIRLLKEEFCLLDIDKKRCKNCYRIDKLAGDDLK